MSLDPAHEALRQQPLSKLGIDLACAVIDHERGEEAVEVAYVLIDLAQVIAEHLSPVDQMLVALTLRQAAIDLLPRRDQGPVVTYMNGSHVSIE
jgi:hypothetical protein